ncbi:MAG: NAD-dependent epimerase/dehydratase family protein [bacterium]
MSAKKSPSRSPGSRTAGSRKRNVLVTGVTGTIGSRLAEALYYDKNVGAIFGVAKGDKPYFFNQFDAKRFIYKNLNILRPRDLTNLFLSGQFKDARIDTVVHLAFFNRMYRPGSKESHHSLNVEGTRDLLDKCIESPSVTKFIFKSSDVVYKIRPHNPIYLDENADLNFDPDVDPWIKDRVDADMICQSRKDNGKVKIVILRCSNIIGRMVSSQMNAYFDSPITFKAMGFNPLINLIHMDDVIQAIQLSIQKNVAGVFNIAGADTAPISTFGEINRSRMLSLPSPLLKPVNAVMRRLGMTRYYYSVDADRLKYSVLLDTSKAQKVLGFKPRSHVYFQHGSQHQE